MKQRGFSFLLTMLMSMMGVEAFAHNIEVANADGVTIYYTYINNRTELEVSCRSQYSGNSTVNEYGEYSGDIVIPSSVTYKGTTYSVTSIGEAAFKDCTGLTSVTIPNSVTIIGQYAFSGCSGLTSVTIPNSVTSIVRRAFDGCRTLSSIVIEDGNNTLSFWNQYDDIYFDCPIENLYLGRNISYNSINGDPCSPFERKTKLSTLTLSSFVNKIQVDQFKGCSGLTSVTIPNSVTSIGESAFKDCSSLTEVNFNATNCTNMGDKNGRVFVNCSSLTSLNIGDNVQNIPSYAFYGCSGLTSVTIGDSVTSIGSSAFENCSGLTGVTFPNSVTSIGNSAFRYCSGLTSVTIPNSVTSIRENAFSNCSSLESVTIGTGVLSIGSDVFYHHRPAKVIWLTNTPPNGYTNAAGTVNYVANDQYTSLSTSWSIKTVYKYLSSLFEVDGVKYVPVSPSERTCDAIDCLYSDEVENIHIGETVTNAGITLKVNRVHPYACYNNNHIKQVLLDLKGDVGDCAFCGCDKVTTATVTNTGVIGNSVFSGCKELWTATLGDKVTGIGQYAFSGCSKLEGIVIPNDVTTIGQYAFQNCSSIVSVNMGNGVSTIEAYTFSGCTSLPTIIIPQTITEVNDNVFSGCKALKDVYIADRDTILTLGSNGSSPLFADCPLDSVYIGGNISYPTSSSYGYSPFYRNTSLRSVTITDEETEISPNEFYGCTNLKNVRIGDGVTTIGNWAFSGCSSLDYFAFGSSVETIGQEAFSDCTAMTNLISHADTPPVCGSQALEDINIWTCKLEVPAGNTAAYAAADQWKEFLFVSEGNINERSFYITYMVDGETYKKEKLKYGASITPEPTPVKEGYIFSGWSEIPTTMPAKEVTVTGTFTLSDINDTTGQNRYIVRILSVGGKPRKELQKDVNIVVMSDGTTQKVVVK